MAINLRCRGPGGQTTLSGLSPDMSVAEFLQLLHSQTGVAPSAAELLTGFPPKTLQLPADPSTSCLRDLGLANGDTFTLRALAAAEAEQAQQRQQAQQQQLQEQARTLAAALTSSLPPAGAEQHHQDMAAADEDADLARALAASLEDAKAHTSGSSSAQPPRSAPAAQPSGSHGPGPAERSVNGDAAPVFVQLADGSCVARRIIDSDNSCLFNAVGYVMEHSRAKAQELRSVIARTVAADPVTYNDGFLGMENEAYCKWILNSDKWGGGIELSILCTHYGREIAAFDIRTKRCDLYGQDAGYSERVMLIYDGLHYDALAVAAFNSAPEELDITIFNHASADGQAIMQGAEKLVEGANKARQFTDTANFTLRCGVCQIGIKGEKEAVEHAKATGHSNFSEY